MSPATSAGTDLPRRLVAEGTGSFFLFATVIGSGIMAENLAGGSEAVALLANTLATGAILFVLKTVRHSPQWVPASVALYITSAYWFTSSTSFANSAITIARSLSDTFAGIAPADVPAFVVAQLLGAALAAVLARFLFAPPEPA